MNSIPFRTAWAGRDPAGTFSFLLVRAGCASLPKTGEKAAPSLDSSRNAKLDHELERETDSDRISTLLFERGHACLEGAESLRAARRAAGEMSGGGTEYGTLILHALRDFEMVVDDFPDTAQAPEALFPLGAIYYYPNIASFVPALRYYQQTISDYPGTESALKARQAIRIIEDNVKQVTDGVHGGEASPRHFRPQPGRGHSSRGGPGKLLSPERRRACVRVVCE